WTKRKSQAGKAQGSLEASRHGHFSIEFEIMLPDAQNKQQKQCSREHDVTRCPGQTAET
ncbi:hypothetical protein J6590_108056, partial [Homalodisca vitripennis]